MRTTLVALTLAVAAFATGVASAADAVTFTRKPAVTKTADGAQIDFAVSGPTDVAVSIESADGKVVRHLAAGVIGPGRTSPPFKADSLEQSVTWDGKADYGKDAGAGQGGQPLTARVALGLRADFDKVLISDPQCMGGVNSLAVGSDGTLYVAMSAGGTGPVWGGQIMLAYDRQGKYLRQLMPFPAGLKPEQAAGFDVVELNGAPAPLVHEITKRSFYAGMIPRKAGMAVTGDGVVLTMLDPCNLGALDSRGGCAWGKYAGPSLQPKVLRARFTGRPFVTASPDGKSAYVSGMLDVRMDAKGSPHPAAAAAVYRVALPGRSPAEVFFGDPAVPGNDQSHLGASYTTTQRDRQGGVTTTVTIVPPRGLACDGKGRLLICDYPNNRVVAVDEKTGKFVKAIAVDATALGGPTGQPAGGGGKPRVSDKDSGPDCIAADPATGAIYLTRLTGKGNIELLKLRSLDEPTVLARLAVPNSGNPDCPWLLALDATADPTICWLGGDGGSLLRVEDRGQAFAKPVEVGTRAIGNGAFVDLSIERTRGEVYTRCGMGSGAYWWFRVNDATGEIKKVTLSPLPGAAGSSMVPGPDGSLYCPAYAYHLLRFDHDGKPKPWTASQPYPAGSAGKDDKQFKVQALPHGRYAPVSMTFLTHTLGVRHDGHVFLFEPSHPGDRPPKKLMEYDAEGNLVGGPIIWKVSDSAVGPKFDPQGNIYIAEQIRQAGSPAAPPEFDKLVGKVELNKTQLTGLPDATCTIYGGIVKFSPAGGMIHFGGENPFDGEPKLDPSAKTVEALSYSGGRLRPIKITGAEWVRMGISHVDIIGCNCENTRFDVDEFGRVWYPDMGRFRVGVLDTNGNPITEFGQYGNGDVTDRLAFSWLIGVIASDRYVYMGDSLNRRLLRAKIAYAAEATCPVR